MIQLWANSTWSLFHTLTANIIEERFDEAFKNECIDLFIKICNTLPCGMCRHHASEHIKTLIKDEIKTAQDLELFFYKFHEEVNKNTKKKVYPQEKLIKYKQKSVK